MTPLDVLLRVSLVLAAAWALAALLRGRPAALRHWVLAAGIVGSAIVPAIGALAPVWHLPRAAVAPASTAPMTSPPRVVTPPPETVMAIDVGSAARTADPAPHVDLTNVVTWTWMAGAVAGLFMLAIGLARLVWIRRAAQPFHDPVWTEIQDDVARAYGLSRRATLLQTDRPLLVTWGILRPTIVVPRGATSWPRARVRAVLAHELAHIARGDWLLQLAAEIVRALHWFNPLAWIVGRRVRLESEHACDDAVLNLGFSGSEYASHLLDLARTMRTQRAAWVPAQAIVRPSSLERRIAAMLNTRLNHSPMSRAGRIAATTALVLVTLAAAGFSAAQATTVLSGNVTDQLGAAIANMIVSLRDLTTNATYQVQTNAAGHYEFAGLPSDDYMMTIKTPGFQTVDQRIVLTGATLERNLTLKLGTVQENITVVSGPGAPMPQIRHEILAKRASPRAPSPCADSGGCVAPPLKKTDKKPIFPDTYTGSGEAVVLKAIIDTTGHVSNLQPVGTPNPDLLQAAITAVSQWEFEPTRLDGQVVETDMTVTVNFKSIQ